MRRVNFAADMIGDTTKPGIKAIIDRLRQKDTTNPESVVDTCLDLLGPLEVSQGSRQELLDHANESGDLSWKSESDDTTSSDRVSEMLQLIVSLREYQYG